MSRHIGQLVSGKLVLTLPSCSLPYLRKVTKAFPITSSGYEMAAERIAWGLFYPPPFNI